MTTRDYKPLPDETVEERVNSGIVCAIAMARGGVFGLEAIEYFGLERHWPEVQAQSENQSGPKRPWWQVWKGGR